MGVECEQAARPFITVRCVGQPKIGTYLSGLEIGPAPFLTMQCAALLCRAPSFANRIGVPVRMGTPYGTIASGMRCLAMW